MSSGSEERFQIAALVVATITALVVIFDLLIFLNPRIAFNPFKPPLPSPTLIAFATGLPPTWTPTPMPTETPTAPATFTVMPSSTAALTTTPTSAPSNTPTLRPATRTATLIPATPTLLAPTPLPAPYPYKTILQSCTHSGGTQIKGTVTSGGQPQVGVRVRVTTDPNGGFVEEQLTRSQSDGSASFAFVLKAIGAFETPATWYVWIVDATGSPGSDPNFSVQTNGYPESNPMACWLAIVNFAK